MALLESNIMQTGTYMPEFQLTDSEGYLFESESLEDYKLVLIVFTCNHCPYAIASWPVLIDLHNHYQRDDLKIVAINSNNNPDYPEDAFETMSRYREQYELEFPYLFDEDQSIAKKFGAVCTPDPFLFYDNRLYYHGRLTDNWQNPEAVREKSMQLFIEAALVRGKAPEQRYPSMGCSIKWV